MDFALRPTYQVSLFTTHLVSILVLVDFALRLSVTSCILSNSICFNPCFSGFRIATHIRLSIYTNNKFVSILVLVDFALRQSMHKINKSTVSVSILFFVFLDLLYSFHILNLSTELVSILVLVDFALRLRMICIVIYAIEVSILVLVDFALRLLSQWLCNKIDCSFNPCFSGFRIATRN